MTILLAVLLTLAQVASSHTPTPAPSDADPVLVGAGDIAACDSDGDEKTAALLDRIEGTVFTLGDNAYPAGTPEEFAKCYEPTWGRHRKRTRPAAGNHDYRIDGAAGYFSYFGASAGDPSRGYYSYDLGKWHVVVLNSNCKELDGCAAGSSQEKWLRQDLAAHAAPCTLAMWHHPRFSSGEHGDIQAMADLWRTLSEEGVDVALAGHDHDYERFAPMDGDGKPDPARGMRSFIVGTGGKSSYVFDKIHPTSEVRNGETFGVLKLTLHPTSYNWEFVPVEGGTFRDSGSASCH
jgi:3',5'-cyclic AMP phosphodiesterase CpdA